MNKDFIKIVVLGTACVGKTALTQKFTQKFFDDFYDPTIEDSYRIYRTINGKKEEIEIVDTAGNEQFVAMRDICIKEGDGFILVYSIISKTTIDELDSFYQRIMSVKGSTNVPIVLCGNKVDMGDQRHITTDRGYQKSLLWKCKFFETSAKNGMNVEEAFLDVIHQAVNKKDLEMFALENITKEPKKRRKCVIY